MFPFLMFCLGGGRGKVECTFFFFADLTKRDVPVEGELLYAAMGNVTFAGDNKVLPKWLVLSI